MEDGRKAGLLNIYARGLSSEREKNRQAPVIVRASLQDTQERFRKIPRHLDACLQQRAHRPCGPGILNLDNKCCDVRG